jgi:hypothetical protein
MPFSPSPDQQQLCEACRRLGPESRGHTFLVPQSRDGSGERFLCLECGAVWRPAMTEQGHRWTLSHVEKKDRTEG